MGRVLAQHSFRALLTYQQGDSDREQEVYKEPDGKAVGVKVEAAVLRGEEIDDSSADRVGRVK